MQAEELRQRICTVLEDMKGQELVTLDVRTLTDVTDFMVIVSGTSDRHVKAMADRVLDTLRDHKLRPLGVEGQETGDWVLIDFGDVVVHVMRPDSRSFYELEKLWSKDLEALVRSQRDKASD